MEKNYNIDDIENFLNQEMDAEALAAFKKEMANDKDLAAEVDFHQDIVKGIQGAAPLDFSKMVSNVHSEMKEEGFFLEEVEQAATSTTKEEAKVRSLGIRRVLAIAASFALIVFAGWWLVSSQSTQPEQIFADNFAVHQDMLSVEIEDRLAETGFGSNKALLNNLQKGIDAYNIKDYPTAISIFEQFEQTATEDPLVNYAKFYKAIAFIETNQLAKAQNSLEQLAEKPNTSLINDINWNLALVYLKQNNIQPAVSILQLLTATETHKVKAETVLKSL